MRTMSLKGRIGASVMILMVLVIGILTGEAYHEFQEGLYDNVDGRLKGNMLAVRHQLSSDDSVDDIKNELEAFLEQSSHGYRTGFDLRNETTGEIFASNPLPAGLAGDFQRQFRQEVPPAGTYRLYHYVEGDMTYRVIWGRYTQCPPVVGPGETLSVAIGVSSDQIQHEVGEFLLVLVIAGGVMTGLMMVSLVWIIRWGLRPVQELTGLMDKVSGQQIDEMHIQYPDAPVELAPFVRAWTRMLERLMQAAREQQRFTSDAAHELRTPLAVMKSTLQVARSRKRTPDYYETAMDQTLEDLDKMNRLIGQLLELSRLDHLSGSPGCDRVDMKALVAGLCGHYEAVAAQTGRTLHYELCEGWLTGRETLLGQMIGNLIENGIKYGPERSTIRVRMYWEGRRLVITVHDEGGAIPESELDQIFERFYRLDKARSRQAGGTGLGLAIVREIAVKHGGDITVQSHPDSGTTFTVRFPGGEQVDSES